MSYVPLIDRDLHSLEDALRRATDGLIAEISDPAGPCARRNVCDIAQRVALLALTIADRVDEVLAPHK